MNPNLSAALLLSLLAIPALWAISNVSFPQPPPPSGLRIHPALGSLPAGTVRDHALKIYGEDYWSGGGWHDGPFGRVGALPLAASAED
jgi:hypothetical protein